MNEPYIASVIIPCYNAENTIHCTMNSVKTVVTNSSCKKIEIIIINDGSSDNTLNKIYNFSWGSLSENIRIIDNENNGVAFTRNMGLKKAKGKYVTFLDSDDIWFSSMSSLLSMLSDISADIIEFNAVRIYDDVNEKKSNSLYPYINKTGFLKKEDISIYKKECCNTFFFPSWGRFYNKSKIGSKQFPLLSTFEDILFVASVLLDAESIFTFCENCVGYRDNPLSLTNNRSLNDVGNISFIISRFYGEFEIKNDAICFKLLFNTYLLLVDNLAYQKKLDKLNDFLLYRKKIHSSDFFKSESLKKRLKFYFPRWYFILYLQGKDFIKKKFPNIFLKLKS